MKLVCAFIALFFMSSLVSAQIHKCRDQSGKLSFSNRPCPTKTSEEKHSLKNEGLDKKSLKKKSSENESWINELIRQKPAGVNILDISTKASETIISYTFKELSDSSNLLRKAHKLSHKVVELIKVIKPKSGSMGVAKIKVSNKGNPIFDSKRKIKGVKPQAIEDSPSDSSGQQDGGGTSTAKVSDISTSLVLQFFNNTEQSCVTNNKEMFFDIFSKNAKKAKYGMLTYPEPELKKYMKLICNQIKQMVLKEQLNNKPKDYQYGLLTFVSNPKAVNKNYYTRLCIYKENICKLSIRAVIEDGTLRLDEH